MVLIPATSGRFSISRRQNYIIIIVALSRKWYWAEFGHANGKNGAAVRHIRQSTFELQIPQSYNQDYFENDSKEKKYFKMSSCSSTFQLGVGIQAARLGP